MPMTKLIGYRRPDDEIARGTATNNSKERVVAGIIV
jgi:hypothetical protein